MEFFRRAANPWNQEVLIGIAWDLMWAALIVGIVFVIGHAVFAWKLAPPEPSTDDAAAPAGVPDRVLRHSLGARAFHWSMSVAMFALLITAFFPVIGVQFAWVTIHWMAGVGLILAVLYHIIHATFWQDLKAMWFGKDDLQEGTQELRRMVNASAPAPAKPGKYKFDHKLYHHTVSLVTLAAVFTGVLMMFRVDTPFWARQPYLLSDGTWGVVYVVHGLSGVLLITMIMAHVYFAIRPEKRWMTWSMINGWIGRKDYLAHHDPARWPAPPADRPAAPPVAGSAALGEGVPHDHHVDH